MPPPSDAEDIAAFKSTAEKLRTAAGSGAWPPPPTASPSIRPAAMTDRWMNYAIFASAIARTALPVPRSSALRGRSRRATCQSMSRQPDVVP